MSPLTLIVLPKAPWSHSQTLYDDRLQVMDRFLDRPGYGYCAICGALWALGDESDGCVNMDCDSWQDVPIVSSPFDALEEDHSRDDRGVI